jgi:hypothetical protein
MIFWVRATDRGLLMRELLRFEIPTRVSALRNPHCMALIPMGDWCGSGIGQSQKEGSNGCEAGWKRGRAGINGKSQAKKRDFFARERCFFS